ncbi:MAG: transglutaminase-like domain-containing protein [Promethearchaeota archaeon]
MENREICEIQLIADQDDIIIKRFVAGIWKENNLFTGFTYQSSLLLDGAALYQMVINSKIRANCKILYDHHTIEVEFLKPIAKNEKYSYELQLLPNPKGLISKLGTLNILEWPKDDLNEIIFLKNSGKIQFSSVLAKIEIDPKSKIRKIVPGQFAKSLKSHARNASAIRIEWGRSPKIFIDFKYMMTNRGPKVAQNIELKTYIPFSTKFQRVHIKNLSIGKIITDEDKNNILILNIKNMDPGEQRKIQFQIEVESLGNLGILMPFFGTWKGYHELTTKGTIGNALIQESKYWPINDPTIQKLIKLLKKNAINASKFIELAFEFVNQKIKYKINSIRADAAETMHTRTGDCSEMSDLFVCILRGGRIPAKIVHGFIIDLETHELGPHAWCEFFAPKTRGWTQSDPTWGFLSGVSCQHITRQREGIVPDQNTFSWRFQGQTQLDITESISIDNIL